MQYGTLVIVRHGESEWNATGQWTGITDVHLTPKGHHEAELMGEQLRDIRFNHAYISEQVRTLETLQSLLKSQGQSNVPYDRRRAINERDYGEYTGLNKWEVKDKIGTEAFNGVRRDWDYPVPGGETLKNVYHRALPFLLEEVLPRIKAGENILLVAHGNSIRALIKYIENISDQNIAKTEMIFGTILLYELDESGHVTHKQERRIQTTLPPA